MSRRQTLSASAGSAAVKRRALRASAGIAFHFIGLLEESLSRPLISVAAFFPRSEQGWPAAEVYGLLSEDWF